MLSEEKKALIPRLMTVGKPALHRLNRTAWEEAFKLYEKDTKKKLNRGCDSCLKEVWSWLHS